MILENNLIYYNEKYIFKLHCYITNKKYLIKLINSYYYLY